MCAFLSLGQVIKPIFGSDGEGIEFHKSADEAVFSAYAFAHGKVSQRSFSMAWLTLALAALGWGRLCVLVAPPARPLPFTPPPPLPSPFNCAAVSLPLRPPPVTALRRLHENPPLDTIGCACPVACAVGPFRVVIIMTQRGVGPGRASRAFVRAAQVKCRTHCQVCLEEKLRLDLNADGSIMSVRPSSLLGRRECSRSTEGVVKG